MCGSGGLATLSISYYDLGYKAGEMAYEILVNGAEPATTPIGFVSTVLLQNTTLKLRKLLTGLFPTTWLQLKVKKSNR